MKIIFHAYLRQNCINLHKHKTKMIILSLLLLMYDKVNYCNVCEILNHKTKACENVYTQNC